MAAAIGRKMAESLPRCDYTPRGGHRCASRARVRVLRSHGGGIDPVYRERCLKHGAVDMGPKVAAVWEDDGRWVAVDQVGGGW